MPVGECGNMAATGAQQGPAAAPKAVYFMTNAKQNSIVALKVAQDGTLSDGTITSTGGGGSTEVDPSTGAPTVPDALSSQGSVRVAGNMVFAVNAGSNTVSMLKMDNADPTKLTMVGQPANTCGEFPVTMAVSTKNKMVCVANSGAVAGVSCGKFHHKTGISAMDALRPFQLNQKTPPSGPLNTVADTFFNEAQNMLFTTVKGNPAVNNTGFLSAFAVAQGAVSTKETRSSPAGTAVLFGTNQIPGTNNLLATDASFGAAILGTSANGEATVQKATKVANQKATCWVTVSKTTGSAFLTDVGVNHLLEMDTTTGAIKEMNLTNTNPGMIDIESSGDFMYALSPGNENVTSAVAVFDVSGGKGKAKQIQNFNPQGVSSTAQGMAVA
ncbi:MAG: hypothetical protein MMC23_009267 [Stictis urceolatum]|nr:hypothetical protein [Stictis urceolata]